jgi:hypothetical protein
LENRLRFDVVWLHSGSMGTTLLDGGKGLDLIVGRTTEVQIAVPPYIMRRSPADANKITGFGDWPFFRIEERLASSPQNEKNYVITAFLQVQAPTGSQKLSNDVWVFSPMLGFGKGWRNFDIQGTITAGIPATTVMKTGRQLQTNLAVQYRFWDILWPEVEASWTYFPDGTRAGLHQLFLTFGLVIGRVTVTEDLRVTVGAGYQFTITPRYREHPFTPAFDRGWLLSTRFNFE